MCLEQPESFDDGSVCVCWLNGSLYGLKQPPRFWCKQFISFMEKYGLKKSTADPYLLYHTHEDNFLYIEIYVDDGLVIGNNDEDTEVFLGLLQEKLARLGSSSECKLSSDLCEPRGVYEQDTEKVQQGLNKMCRHLPVAKKVITTKTSVARFHIVRQSAVSCFLRQQRALTSHLS